MPTSDSPFQALLLHPLDQWRLAGCSRSLLVQPQLPKGDPKPSLQAEDLLGDRKRLGSSSRASSPCCLRARSPAPISHLLPSRPGPAQSASHSSAFLLPLSFLTSSCRPPAPSVAGTLVTIRNHWVIPPHLPSRSLLSTQQSPCPSLPLPPMSLLLPPSLGRPTAPQVRFYQPFTAGSFPLALNCPQTRFSSLACPSPQPQLPPRAAAQPPLPHRESGAARG